MMTPSFPLQGEIASLLAALIWACSISCYSRFGGHVRAGTLNLFKNIVGLLCLGVAGSLLGWAWPKSLSPYLAFGLSGLVGLALGDTLMFYGMRKIGPQTATVLQCLAPPFAAVLAWLVFDESLSIFQWTGMTLTVCALAFVVAERPSTGVVRAFSVSGLLAALGAALCQALAVLILRRALQGTDVMTGTLLRLFPAIVGLSFVSLLRGQGRDLRRVFEPMQRGVIITLAAFFGTFIGLLLMSTGAKYAKAGVMTAISSTYPIWIMPIAHFGFKERVSARQLIWTVLAVLGVALMMAEQFR